MILAQIFPGKKHQKTKTNLIAKSKPNQTASVAAKKGAKKVQYK